MLQSAPFRIVVKASESAGEVSLQLTGPLVLDNLFDFQKTWREQSAPNVVVDLTNVPYVDSSGIGSLVNLHVSRQKIGGNVVLFGVVERVKTALMVTRVDKVLNIRDAETKNAASA